MKLFKFGHCRYVFLKAVSRVTEEEMNCLFLSIVAISLLFDLGSAFHGLKSNSALITSSLKVGAPLSSSSSLGMFKKKESKPAVDPADYWQGEWICADCGYIYDRDVDGGGLYFEELKKGIILLHSYMYNHEQILYRSSVFIILNLRITYYKKLNSFPNVRFSYGYNAITNSFLCSLSQTMKRFYMSTM